MDPQSQDTVELLLRVKEEGQTRGPLNPPMAPVSLSVKVGILTMTNRILRDLLSHNPSDFPSCSFPGSSSKP